MNNLNDTPQHAPLAPVRERDLEQDVVEAYRRQLAHDEEERLPEEEQSTN